MPKWIKRILKPKPQLPEAPIEEQIAAVLNRSKKCPNCQHRYEDKNFIVCAMCGTLLLTAVKPTFSSWYEMALRPDKKVCPQCQFEVDPESPTLFCPKDNEVLRPDAVLDDDDEKKEAPWIEDRFQPLSYINSDDVFEIYLGRDKTSERIVLIKFLRSIHCRDQQTTARFLSLAKPALVLRHENLISTHSVNLAVKPTRFGLDTQQKIPYVVSDFVDSQSLETLLAQRKHLTPAEAITVIADVLAALQYAHEKEVVHGAIYTSNIHVHSDNSDFHGLLTNFGVAERLLRELDWDGPSTDTRTAGVYGNSRSITPEFCHGIRANKLSDIYQIGCVLYEMVCGAPPFQREHLTMVLLAHMKDEPDDIDKNLPGLPDRLKTTIYRCLAKEPENRYPSAEALRDELLRIKEELESN